METPTRRVRSLNGGAWRACTLLAALTLVTLLAPVTAAGSTMLPCSVSSPQYSGAVSSTNAFTVSWSASGAATFDVQYADGASGSWVPWLTGTAFTSQAFSGTAGHTYFFRARAADGVGGVGAFSAPVRTSVPVDEASMSYSSGWKKASQSGAYLGSTHYATAKGKTAFYTFTGTAVVLLVTKAKARGKADIYIDGKRVKTIDTYASKTYVRQAIFSSSLAAGKHTIKVSVLATSKRPRVDVDGVEVYSPHTAVPVFTAALEGGACTGTRSMMLSLSSSDGYGVTDTEVSEDASFAGASFVPFASEVPVTLSSSDGTKTVRVRVRDAFGTVSAPIPCVTFLDTTPPAISGCSDCTFMSGSPYTLTATVRDSSAVSAVLHVRSTAGGSFQDVPMTMQGSTAQATLPAAMLGSSACSYYVTAVDAAGNSCSLPAGAPAAVFALTPGVVPPPAVPGGLGVVCGSRSCSLSWNAVVGGGVAGYRLYRSGSSTGPWTQVADTASASTIDSTALNGHTYYYTVSCYGGTGAESAKCDPVAAVLPARLGSLQVSAPLTVTSGTAFTVTVLAFDDNGSVFTGFADPVSLSTDGAGSFSPSSVPGFVGGSANVQATYTGSGTMHVKVADGAVSAASGSVTVVTAGGPPPPPAVLGSFSVVGPDSATTDQPFTVTIIALDTNGQTFTNYSGTVMLSTPGAGVLTPASASGFSGGILQVSVSYPLTGPLYISVTDGTVSGNGAPINVLAPGQCGCGG